MEKEIGKINKGEFQGTITDIVVGVKEYQGRVGVDIREFASGERYTGPTKKGLRIPAESFSKFKELINSINEEDLKADSSSEESEQNSESQKDSPEKESSEEKPKEEKTEENEEMPDY
ncbi:MAG: transcriptional coactivator p15/PC4 family protein [Candidatus Pacearchaeota archaeon]